MILFSPNYIIMYMLLVYSNVSVHIVVHIIFIHMLLGVGTACYIRIYNISITKIVSSLKSQRYCPITRPSMPCMCLCSHARTIPHPYFALILLYFTIIAYAFQVIVFICFVPINGI